MTDNGWCRTEDSDWQLIDGSKSDSPEWAEYNGIGDETTHASEKIKFGGVEVENPN